VGAEVIPARESSLGTRARDGCASTDVLTIAAGSAGFGASGNITAETWKRRTVAARKLVTPPLCHGWARPTMKRLAQILVVRVAGTTLAGLGLRLGSALLKDEYY
jgi:hypothetical protein